MNVNATARCVIVGLTICSWLTISNHCALMAVAAPVADLQSACPFHSKPTKQKEQSSQLQCCKILRAIMANSAKHPARLVIVLADVDIPFVELVVFAWPKISVNSVALDTGPPGAFSFAELILQRSLHAHAPPILA
jgi:hypothetical protein